MNEPNYGLFALPLAVIMVLAQAIYTMTKRRRDSNHTEDFRAELRSDIKDLKRTMTSVQELLNALITKMALVEYRVTRLEDKRGPS